MRSATSRPGTGSRPPRHRRARGRMLLYLLPVIIAVAAGGIWYLSKKKTPSILDIVGRAPETSSIVLTISRPAEMLRDLASKAKSLSKQNPELGSSWEEARGEARKVLGFDFTDPAGWSKAGFDLSVPLMLAFQEFDKRGEPQSAVFTVGVSDGKAALEMIEGIASQEKATIKKDDGDPPITMIDGEAAVAVRKNRLYIAVGERRTDLAGVLRRYMRGEEKSPLSKNTDFRAAARGVAGKGLLGGYINLRSIIASISQRPYGPPPPPITKDFAALAFRCDEKETLVYLLLAGESGLLEFLEPGAECRDFLASMDEPLAAYTFSMARPVEFVLHFMQESGAGDQVAAVKGQISMMTGLSFEKLASLARNGAGGVALYPCEQRFSPISVASFIRLSDRPAALAALEQAMGPLASMGVFQVEKHGENVLYNQTGPYASSSIGIVGEYFVSGSAVAQIRNLASGKAAGWKPDCGGRGLLEAEMRLGKIVDVFGEMIPSEAHEVFSAMGFDANSRLTATATRQGDGLLYRIGGEGSGAMLAATIAAIAIPNLVQSGREANQVVAIASLRTISTAQNTWHRNDHDLNALLDFTPQYRSLHYQLDLAGRKISYIDKALADASGVGGIPKHGYLFGDMTTHWQTGRYNYRYEYGLCAWPAKYGKTGTMTFITSAEGTIFQQDRGLASGPITVYPNTAVGWEIVH